jgi:AraC-like DNA-binding protein/mannose-6-phosphate isomerase-like protein (cupin superfamily)
LIIDKSIDLNVSRISEPSVTRPAIKKRTTELSADSETLRRLFSRLNDAQATSQLGAATVRILYWGANPDRCTDAAPHSHSFFEVCYVFRGSGTFTLDGSTHCLKAGQLFVSRPEQVHHIDTSITDPMGIYFWAFTLDAPAVQNATQPIDELARGFASSSRTLATIKTKTMERTLGLLTDEVERREPGFDTAVASLTQKLLLDTFRALLDEPLRRPLPPVAERSTHTAALMAERFMRDNFRRAITLEDIARQVHVSPRHLSRVFRRGMGITIAKYLTSLRIEAAGRMLLEGGVNIKQIAADCGHPDVAYFTTLFRKTTGYTPAVYREKRGQVYPLRPAAGRKT